MVCCCMLAVLCVAPAAWAAGETPEDGIHIDSVEPSTDWRTVVYPLVATGGVCAVAFKNCKRTHLD